MTHVFYFDRDIGKQTGRLTLQYTRVNAKTKKVEVVEVFKRLKALSGQRGHLGGGSQDWVKGQSPTPMGSYWLKTKKESLTFEPIGTPFYLISDEQGRRTMKGPDGIIRDSIGLHLDNSIPSTIGCTGLSNSTPEEKCINKALFAYLDELSKTEPYIRYHVV